MRLTQHFTLQEATHSATAIARNLSNSPSPAELSTIIFTANKMEEVRKILNKPIIVNSWFRSEAVNRAVGGVPNSQHRKGEAVDFVCTGFTPLQICNIIREHADTLQYDQLIREPSWTHISFIRSGIPRKQYLDLSR